MAADGEPKSEHDNDGTQIIAKSCVGGVPCRHDPVTVDSKSHLEACDGPLGQTSFIGLAA